MFLRFKVLSLLLMSVSIAHPLTSHALGACEQHESCRLDTFLSGVQEPDGMIEFQEVLDSYYMAQPGLKELYQEGAVYYTALQTLDNNCDGLLNADDYLAMYTARNTL